MSLIHRKPRPLARDTQSLRDDRLFIIASDDTYAPKQYFGFFRLTRVQVHVVPSEGGESSANHVLERLLKFEHEDDDELWMLLDTDHNIRGRHLKSFVSAIKTAKDRGVNVALSKPCFELWLLLHHMEGANVGLLEDAGMTEKVLREALGQYDKTNLKQEHYPIESVVRACARAEELDAMDEGGNIPSGNVSQVYRLWKAIAVKALPSQLPPELKELLT